MQVPSFPQPAVPGPARSAAAFAAPAPAPADPGAAPNDFAQRLKRWVVRASVIGAVVSLLVHIVLMLIAAVVYFQVAQAGGAGAAPGEIELAIVTEAELQALEAAALEVDTPVVPDVVESTPEGPPMDGPGGDDLPAAGADIGGIADALRGTGDGLDRGSDLGGGGMGGGAASFFGVEARGDRFAYIVDTSGSMRGEKLDRLKVELLESINALSDHQHFYIVPFNSEAYSLGGKLKWSAAGDGEKRWAREHILILDAAGGTNPLPGFEIALRITPRPDAIYFMTDGMFEPSFADEIARINRSGRRVPIHCLTFGDRSAEPLMREIAKQSGGTYHHIEAPN